jgi:hypothetical protein
VTGVTFAAAALPVTFSGHVGTVGRVA